MKNGHKNRTRHFITVNKTREAAGFAAKVLHLGSLYSLTVNTIPNVISGLKLRRSELDIQLLLSSNQDLVKKLKATELDAIIVALNETTQDDDFEILPMFSDDIFWPSIKIQNMPILKILI